ncbi:hypothetical protein JQ596_38990 [Bradyrhizobium manausense]|uniref:hypothetical protein n=1 Tax=Bradyrhizobium TaxID=374 RepID=UPI001BA7A264|nr:MULTISPECIES: hypothetical protein [Bradyrhizobium]MBR0831508.1 hypothetical protein [Bradyrhizobium manausense]UVO33592.1 hypothetical protein KUF59_31925 [Bradyrhizobium arachidis]
MTHDQFLEGRLQVIRTLAAAADPFIKRRLLDLAKTYERKIAGLGSSPPKRQAPTGQRIAGLDA